MKVVKSCLKVWKIWDAKLLVICKKFIPHSTSLGHAVNVPNSQH
jgi:hypothetical protein